MTQLFEAFKKMYKPQPGHLALVIGLRDEEFLLYLAEKGVFCSGIDTINERVENIRKKAAEKDLQNIQDLKTISSLRMQYPDEYFDLIVCPDIINYLSPDDARFLLREMMRVLKHDGILVMDILNDSKKARELVADSQKKDIDMQIIPKDRMKNLFVVEKLKPAKKKTVGVKTLYLLKRQQFE